MSSPGWLLLLLAMLAGLALGAGATTLQRRRRARQQRRRACDAVAAPCLLLYPDGRIALANAAARILLGTPLAHLDELPLSAETRHWLGEHGNGGETRRCELSRPAAAPLLLRLEKRPADLDSLNGGLTWLLLHDVSQQDDDERGQQLWREALQDSRLALFEYRLATRRVYGRVPAVDNVLGLPPGWVDIGFDSWLERVHPDDRDALRTMLEHPEQLAAGSAYLEFRFRHGHGHWEWLEQRAQLLHEEGRVSAIVGLCQSITSRKHAETELLRREQVFRTLVENADDVIARYDLNLYCQFINRSITRYLPLPRHEHQGKTLRQQGWPQSALDTLEPAFQAVLARHEARHLEVELDVFGKTATFSIHLIPELGAHGELVSILAIGREITELRLGSRLLADENAVMEMIANNQPLDDILARLCRLLEAQRPQAICSIMLLNEQKTELNLAAGPSLPASFSGFLHGLAIGPETGSCGTAAFFGKQVVVSDIALDPRWENYRYLALPHGLRSCWSTPIYSSSREMLGAFAVYYPTPRNPGKAEMRLADRCTHLASIALERDRHEKQLYFLATRDGLTGLLNRRSFMEVGESEVLRSKRYGHNLSIMMMDLDHFKNINDQHGHATGDQVLQHFATLCGNTFRHADIIGRVGGEEFGVLLPFTTLTEAGILGERLRAEVDGSVVMACGVAVHYTVSIGIAAVCTDDKDIDGPLSRADTLLYQAKTQGRNRIRYDDPPPLPLAG
ncbi:MAG TPA: diguanylate cyclase [Pseudogulbenkiania sp.]|nr:diguanylate cyclase [Pseudogulbenkiania sp.]